MSNVTVGLREANMKHERHFPVLLTAYGVSVDKSKNKLALLL